MYTTPPTAADSLEKSARSQNSNSGRGDSMSPAELHLAVQAIVEQLRRESLYLDTVIGCSLKMKDLLVRSNSRQLSKPENGSRTSEKSASAGSPTTNVARESDGIAMDAPATRSAIASPQDELTDLRGDLARQFVPVFEGRQEMQSALQHLETLFDAPPTLTRLATQVTPSLRNELKQLRTDIKSKLQEVQAITMGNQAVLLYTLDFYHRLMSGIAGEPVSAKAYNSQGHMTNQTSKSMLEKRC